MTDLPSRALVFVLGAGASTDFGSSMPVGAQLAQLIEQQLNAEFASGGGSDGPIKQALMRTTTGLRPADVKAANQIRRAIFAQPSIDDLLNEWRDDEAMIRVGKLAITNAILTAERDSVLGKTAADDDDQSSAAISGLRNCWLAFLPGISRRDVSKVFANVGFVVFNYDRCIEQYLYWAFQSVAGLSSHDAAQAVKRIPIVHVYGDLGPLPFGAGKPRDVAFGIATTIHEYMFQRIKTYTEEDHDQKNLAVVRSLIRNAARIVFLGLGYHERNMQLLLSNGDIRFDCKVWGTSLNPDPTRLEAVRQLLYDPRRTGPQLSNSDCSSFLFANRPILTDI